MDPQIENMTWNSMFLSLIAKVHFLKEIDATLNFVTANAKGEQFLKL